MQPDRDRFSMLRVLGAGTRTTTEQSVVQSGDAAERVITVVRLRPEAEADPRVRDTFVRKARVLMALTEPSIATTIEFGHNKGTHYVARGLDVVTCRGLGFSGPSFVGISGLAATLATTIAHLRAPEPTWLDAFDPARGAAQAPIVSVTPPLPLLSTRKTHRWMVGAVLLSVAAIAVAAVLLFA